MINGKEELEIEEGNTNRGFAYVSFKDLYNRGCSIQLSSIATAQCIWLGVDDEPVNLNDPEGPRQPVHARMHLNAKQAKQLCKLIKKFLKENP